MRCQQEKNLPDKILPVWERYDSWLRVWFNVCPLSPPWQVDDVFGIDLRYLPDAFKINNRHIPRDDFVRVSVGGVKAFEADLCCHDSML